MSESPFGRCQTLTSILNSNNSPATARRISPLAKKVRSIGFRLVEPNNPHNKKGRFFNRATQSPIQVSNLASAYFPSSDRAKVGNNNSIRELSTPITNTDRSLIYEENLRQQYFASSRVLTTTENTSMNSISHKHFPKSKSSMHLSHCATSYINRSSIDIHQPVSTRLSQFIKKSYLLSSPQHSTKLSELKCKTSYTCIESSLRSNSTSPLLNSKNELRFQRDEEKKDNSYSSDNFEYILISTMQRIEDEIVAPRISKVISKNSQFFDGQCFDLFSSIVNDASLSLAIRVEKQYLQQTSSLDSKDSLALLIFIEFINLFTCWFCSNSVQTFDDHVSLRAADKTEFVKIQIDKLSETLKQTEEELSKSDRSLEATLKQLDKTKREFAEDKRELLIEIGRLEDQIAEFIAPQALKEVEHQMNIKLVKLEKFLNNLEEESAATKDQFKDSLSAIGFSAMTKNKTAFLYDSEIRKQAATYLLLQNSINDIHTLDNLDSFGFRMRRSSTQSVTILFSRHSSTIVLCNAILIPLKKFSLIFVTATFERSQSASATPKRGEEEIVIRLKEFFEKMIEPISFQVMDFSDCAESFMEFILDSQLSQHNAFIEIEETVRYLDKERMKPLSGFFARLFGINGQIMPTLKAVKEVVNLSRAMGRTQLDSEVMWDSDLEAIVCQVISNSSIVLERLRIKQGTRAQKCQILGLLLFALSRQDELDKSDDIYSLISVSSSETSQSIEQKLSFTMVRRIAKNIPVKPMILFSYFLQTFEAFTRERKKKLESTLPDNPFVFHITNSQHMPKALRDSFLVLSDFAGKIPGVRQPTDLIQIKPNNWIEDESISVMPQEQSILNSVFRSKISRSATPNRMIGSSNNSEKKSLIQQVKKIIRLKAPLVRLTNPLSNRGSQDYKKVS